LIALIATVENGTNYEQMRTGQGNVGFRGENPGQYCLRRSIPLYSEATCSA